MTLGLVLSLFPGLDFLGRAFEQEGWCVVRGPDPIWGGDVRDWHVPAGRFEGVIGGPPCQQFSSMAAFQWGQGRETTFGNLIPEFCRVVFEAQPTWFLMENVITAPLPEVAGYYVESLLLNNRWLGGVQNRERRFSFGTSDGRKLKPWIEVVVLEAVEKAGAVTSAHLGDGRKRTRGEVPRYTLRQMLALQGFPEDMLAHCSFTQDAARKAVANGVPLLMGLAVARAVKQAMGLEVLP